MHVGKTVLIIIWLLLGLSVFFMIMGLSGSDPVRKAFPIIIWLLFGLSVFVMMVGLSGSEPEGKVILAGFGGMCVCFLVPFLAACYVRPRLWFAVLFAVLVVVSVLYANAWASKSAGTIYVHPLDHAYMLWFCIPGVLTLLVRWRKAVSK